MYGPLTTLLKCWIIGISELSDVRLKGFCHTLFNLEKAT